MMVDENPAIRRRDELLEILRSNMDEIRRFGVLEIGFFGSFARNEADDGSDVDIVVRFERGKATFRNVSGLIEYLEGLLSRPVDLLTPSGIENIRIDGVRERIEEDVVYV